MCIYIYVEIIWYFYTQKCWEKILKPVRSACYSTFFSSHYFSVHSGSYIVYLPTTQCNVTWTSHKSPLYYDDATKHTDENSLD